MQGLFPPLCLLLAFALAVCGFAIWAREGPEAGTQLHTARASGDDNSRDALESHLEQKQLERRVLLGLLVTASVTMTVLGFASMRGPQRPLSG